MIDSFHIGAISPKLDPPSRTNAEYALIREWDCGLGAGVVVVGLGC